MSSALFKAVARGCRLSELMVFVALSSSLAFALIFFASPAQAILETAGGRAEASPTLSASPGYVETDSLRVPVVVYCPEAALTAGRANAISGLASTALLRFMASNQTLLVVGGREMRLRVEGTYQDPFPSVILKGPCPASGASPLHESVEAIAAELGHLTWALEAAAALLSALGSAFLAAKNGASAKRTFEALIEIGASSVGLGVYCAAAVFLASALGASAGLGLSLLLAHVLARAAPAALGIPMALLPYAPVERLVEAAVVLVFSASLGHAPVLAALARVRRR